VTLRGMPGIDGGLGCCCWCGGPFVTEILLGKSVRSIKFEAFDDDFVIHEKCLTLLSELVERNSTDWKSMPEASPIRRAFEGREAEGEGEVKRPTLEEDVARFRRVMKRIGLIRFGGLPEGESVELDAIERILAAAESTFRPAPGPPRLPRNRLSRRQR
jgi:hypothetical protein